MQIISGSSNKVLAKKISKNTGYRLLNTEIKNFNDGELRVEIQDRIGKDVTIVQSTSFPVNDHLMELLLLIDTAKRAGAENIIGIIPYFGYSRQDRPTYQHGPISANLVIKLLESAGVTKIITLDLHSRHLESIFNIPILNLDPASIFLPFFKDSQDIVVVSPDMGGISRARNFCSLFGKNLIVINKSRDTNNVCLISEIIGNVHNKKCIIIDDIIDSGNTLCKAAEALKVNGALAIEAYVTHPVLSINAKEKLILSPIDKIFVSDSIYHRSLPDKFVTVFTDDLLTQNCINN